MVLPDWRSEDWWQRIQQYVVKKYYYRQGTKVFELPGKEVQGTPWGVWAYLTDCRSEEQKKKRRQKEDELMPIGRTIEKEEWEEQKVRTAASARRARRKYR